MSKNDSPTESHDTKGNNESVTQEDHSFFQVDCRDLLATVKSLKGSTKSILSALEKIEDNWRDPESVRDELKDVITDFTNNSAIKKHVSTLEQFYDVVKESS